MKLGATRQTTQNSREPARHQSTKVVPVAQRHASLAVPHREQLLDEQRQALARARPVQQRLAQEESAGADAAHDLQGVFAKAANGFHQAFLPWASSSASGVAG